MYDFSVKGDKQPFIYAMANCLCNVITFYYVGLRKRKNILPVKVLTC